MKPEDIKLMINGHAHIDHAGAFAYLKEQAPGAQLAVMREDVPAMESGDRNDFKYSDDFVYPAVKVDRVLRDGDTMGGGGGGGAHHTLEILKPDIWLAQHNEYYDLEGKREARRDRRREGVDRPRRLSPACRRQEARLRG